MNLKFIKLIGLSTNDFEKIPLKKLDTTRRFSDLKNINANVTNRKVEICVIEETILNGKLLNIFFRFFFVANSKTNISPCKKP